MGSNGTQRRVDDLLDQAKKNSYYREWYELHLALQSILKIDPKNQEALELQRQLTVQGFDLADYEEKGWWKEQSEQACLGVMLLPVFAIMTAIGCGLLYLIIREQIDEGALWFGRKPVLWFGVLAFLAAMGIAGIAGLVWVVVVIFAMCRRVTLSILGR
jgi:hypothetical protein